MKSLILICTLMTCWLGQNHGDVLKADQKAKKKNSPHPWNDVCMDVYPTEKCKVLKHKFHFCNDYYMDKLCKKTCNYCRAHGQVDCRESSFGCCSDKVTPKKDLLGSNCPACKDDQEELCVKYEADCNAGDFVGNWMRLNCKRTCKICKDRPIVTCKDSELHKKFCPLFKRAGLCEKTKVIMQKQCPKTCNFCE